MTSPIRKVMRRKVRQAVRNWRTDQLDRRRKKAEKKTNDVFGQREIEASLGRNEVPPSMVMEWHDQRGWK